MLKSLYTLRKLSGGPWLLKTGICSRQERQVRKFNFFAPFAPLREIFRLSCGFAAGFVCG
jgi:hypothetical protein